MNEPVIYSPMDTPVMRHAAQRLRQYGAMVVDAPSADVTQLLMPVPTTVNPHAFLSELPSTVCIIGGNLDIPGYRCTDLLKDDLYLYKNATLTAHIAAGLAARELPVILSGCPVLILGWGRIGKCLGLLLRDMGADVTAAARKPSDRAMIEALGCKALNIGQLGWVLRRFRVIFNTVPSPVINEEQLTYCRPDCLKMELASKPGIAGADVLQARGLPGKYAPESSGKLIAETVLRLLAQKEEPL